MFEHAFRIAEENRFDQALEMRVEIRIRGGRPRVKWEATTGKTSKQEEKTMVEMKRICINWGKWMKLMERSKPLAQGVKEEKYITLI